MPKISVNPGDRTLCPARAVGQNQERMGEQRVGEVRIFGTDGIRGRAGVGWLTEANVALLGRVTADVLGRGDKRREVLLGHDGRRSGPVLEAALACGLAAGGLKPVSAGLISTPGLALLAHLGQYAGAAMISASHNPAEDNGIKLFGPTGEKLTEEAEREIERRLAVVPDPPVVPEGSPPRHDPELELRYLTYLVERAAKGLELDSKAIVIDCANGGASRVAPRVLGRLGAQVTAIHAEPDGDNINRGCGSTQPQDLISAVRSQRAVLGIALDGDGDRCVLVDERGQLVHGDGILTVCGLHAARAGRLPRGRIVATVMSNRGLHRALRSAGVSVDTVAVGDKHVVERLRQEGLGLGGEQSGHVVFGTDHFLIGDGIYTALRVLRIMFETKQPLSVLAAPYQPMPQVLLNVPVSHKPRLEGLTRLAQAVARVESELGEDGRVLLRYSGTESLARVMVEGPDGTRIQQHARELAGLIEAEIG
jgi:phosphoglucosamine mutase